MMEDLYRPKSCPKHVPSACPENVRCGVLRPSYGRPVNTPIPHALGTLAELVQSLKKAHRHRNAERLKQYKIIAESDGAFAHG